MTLSTNPGVRHVAARARLVGTTALAAAAAAVLVAGCSGAGPTGSPTSPAAPASTAATVAGTPAGALVIDVTLADGTVDPNGKKIDVAVGQTVIINVTSDHDDEVHVHSDPGVELEVTANTPTSGQFVASESGSFEMESHHPEKIIAILNVR